MVYKDMVMSKYIMKLDHIGDEGTPYYNIMKRVGFSIFGFYIDISKVWLTKNEALKALETLKLEEQNEKATNSL